MGSCFSVYSAPTNQITAQVITLKGTLRQFPVDVTVSQVLESETTQSCFICSSDGLYYDEFIQALNPKEGLEAGQIYFILPANRLQYRLTASDMAALAVKASSAIGSKREHNSSRKTRISPVVEVNQGFNQNGFGNEVKRFDKSSRDIELTRSSSVRKLHTSASRRTKMAIRSFRLKLTTIHECSVVE